MCLVAQRLSLGSPFVSYIHHENSNTMAEFITEHSRCPLGFGIETCKVKASKIHGVQTGVVRVSLTMMG
jgi:hypothetical protein